MLSDPLSVTIDGSTRQLPRAAAALPQQPRSVGRTTYRTGDGAYTVATQQFERKDGGRRVEITLSKAAVDTDANTFYTGAFSTSVGLVFETAPYGLSTQSEVLNIRNALNAFVDSGLMARLCNGEH